MLNYNEELERFQPCADLESAEENIYGKELEEIKKNKTELYKANQMIKKYNGWLQKGKVDPHLLIYKKLIRMEGIIFCVINGMTNL